MFSPAEVDARSFWLITSVLALVFQVGSKRLEAFVLLLAQG